MAMDLAQPGVRVDALYPGFVESELARAITIDGGYSAR